METFRLDAILLMAAVAFCVYTMGAFNTAAATFLAAVAYNARAYAKRKQELQRTLIERILGKEGSAAAAAAVNKGGVMPPAPLAESRIEDVREAAGRGDMTLRMMNMHLERMWRAMAQAGMEAQLENMQRVLTSQSSDASAAATTTGGAPLISEVECFRAEVQQDRPPRVRYLDVQDAGGISMEVRERYSMYFPSRMAVWMRLRLRLSAALKTKTVTVRVVVSQMAIDMDVRTTYMRDVCRMKVVFGKDPFIDMQYFITERQDAPSIEVPYLSDWVRHKMRRVVVETYCGESNALYMEINPLFECSSYWEPGVSPKTSAPTQVAPVDAADTPRGKESEKTPKRSSSTGNLMEIRQAAVRRPAAAGVASPPQSNVLAFGVRTETVEYAKQLAMFPEMFLDYPLPASEDSMRGASLTHKRQFLFVCKLVPEFDVLYRTLVHERKRMREDQFIFVWKQLISAKHGTSADASAQSVVGSADAATTTAAALSSLKKAAASKLLGSLKGGRRK